MFRLMPVVAALALFACGHHADEPARSATLGSAASADHAAAWRDDLHALATELPARHVHAFARADEATWRRAVADLDARIPSLDDAHVLVGLVKLVAALGDTHTMLGAWATAGVYPVTFAWFDDGIFVIGAPPDQAWAVGDKLVGIGSHSLADSLAAITPLVAHDSDAGLHAHVPDVLGDAALLAGLDLAPAGHATFGLAAADGTTRELAVTAGTAAAQVTPPHELPLHLQGPATNYWNKYDAADHVLFFAYNACADDPRAGTFAQLAAGTLGFIDQPQHPVDRFVIDLRRNEGGNSQLIEPLIAGLAARPALAGRVFAIIGMHTFSSGVLAAMDLSRRLHARLVGGPTSGKPNAYGEIQMFELPRSHLRVQYSTKLFSFPDFPGDALSPDMPVTVTSADWFAGRDPAMTAILAAPVPMPGLGPRASGIR
jgi:hypothetical protein